MKPPPGSRSGLKCLLELLESSRYDIGTTPAAETQSVVANRTYGVTKNASDQLVVNVPWISGGTYSWKVRDNASTPVNKTVLTGEFLQFKTATGALATGLAGTGTTSDPYVMTLTSPNDNTTYDVMGSGNSYAAGLVLAGSATNGGNFLRKDGTWQVPPNTQYSDFTVSTNSVAGTAGLVPAPAIGTQGGGQHTGDGGPGCEKQLIDVRIRINIKYFLFFIFHKFTFLFNFFMLKLDICNVLLL